MKVWMGKPEMALEIETDWIIGSPIVVRGVHNAPFRNTGNVLEFAPSTRLAYTHMSSFSRLADEPASYTTLEFVLAPANGATSLTLRASGFPTVTIYKHLQFYWAGTLEVLKQHVERSIAPPASVDPGGLGET